MRGARQPHSDPLPQACELNERDGKGGTVEPRGIEVSRGLACGGLEQGGRVIATRESQVGGERRRDERQVILRPSVSGGVGQAARTQPDHLSIDHGHHDGGRSRRRHPQLAPTVPVWTTDLDRRDGSPAGEADPGSGPAEVGDVQS